MAVLGDKAGCRSADIKVGEIRGGDTRGQGSLWAKLPLAAAKVASEEGIIQVGWFRARIELLEAQPLRCYKCLEKGHVKEKCPSAVDRSNRCYRCGGAGHVSRECTALPKCPICSDLGRRADHAIGGGQCAPQKCRGKTAGVGGPT